MKIRLHPAASEELTGEAAWYAENAGAKVAHGFLREFERALAILSEQPAIGSVWRGGSRRLPLRRYPHTLVYVLRDDGSLEIVAVAHQRRKPGYWRKRL